MDGIKGLIPTVCRDLRIGETATKKQTTLREFFLVPVKERGALVL